MGYVLSISRISLFFYDMLLCYWSSSSLNFPKTFTASIGFPQYLHCSISSFVGTCEMLSFPLQLGARARMFQVSFPCARFRDALSKVLYLSVAENVTLMRMVSPRLLTFAGLIFLLAVAIAFGYATWYFALIFHDSFTHLVWDWVSFIAMAIALFMSGLCAGILIAMVTLIRVLGRVR